MVLLFRLLAGLLALLALSLVSGCDQSPPAARAGAADPGLAALPAEIVDSFLPATGAQNRVGLKLSATETALENSMVAQCMKGDKFSRGERPYMSWDELYLNQLSPSVPGWAGMDVSDVILYDIPLLARGGLLSEVVTATPPPPRLPLAAEHAIDVAYAHCQNSAIGVFSKLDDTGYELERPWLREVNAIRASAPVQRAVRSFTTCAERHGAPAVAAQSPDTFDIWLYRRVRSKPAPPWDIKPSIAARVAEDRHWTQVFVACARTPIALEDRLQLRQQGVFLQAHSKQISALQNMAVQVVSNLERQYGS